MAGLSFRKRFLSARALRGGAEEENFVSQESGGPEELSKTEGFYIFLYLFKSFYI